MTPEEAISTWTPLAAPDNEWYFLCHAPELELTVAVAFNAGPQAVMTSHDGLNWTLQTTPTGQHYACVCWSPALRLFVAVGGGIMTSPDGGQWTARSIPPETNLSSVVWADLLGLFVAVASSGTGKRVLTSADGVNWVSRPTPADNYWEALAWSPELCLLVAVATSGAGNRIMTSPDGLNWTLQNSPADNNWQAICWAKEIGQFIAVSRNGTERAMTSPDGKTWTLQQTPGANSWEGIAWSSALRLAVAVASTSTQPGERLMTSTDGIHWAARVVPAHQWIGIVWADTLNRFVACNYTTGQPEHVMVSGVYSQPIPAPVLVAPQDLRVIGNRQLVTLTWSDGSTAEDRWEVQAQTKAKGPWTVWATLATLAADRRQFAFVPANVQFYKFRVRPCADAACSGWSNEVQLKLR